MRFRFPAITSKVVLAAFAFTAFWAALVITAPLMVPEGTLADLTGVVGSHDNDDQFSSLGPIPRAVYWIGDGECHQIADRSYFLNGNQMPFCARDLGLFLGLAAGFGLATFVAIRIHPVLVLVGLVPMAVDGGIQLVTEYESNNPLRLLTGLIAGLALSLMFAHMIFAIQDGPVKKKPAPVVPRENLSKPDISTR